MDTKKDKLTEETINVDGRTLYRIEALTYFGDVKQGDKGGFIDHWISRFNPFVNEVVPYGSSVLFI